jgi:hypothetical protein
VFFGCGSGGSLPPFPAPSCSVFQGFFPLFLLLYRIIRASGQFSFSSFRVGVRLFSACYIVWFGFLGVYLVI